MSVALLKMFYGHGTVSLSIFFYSKMHMLLFFNCSALLSELQLSLYNIIKVITYVLCT